MEIGSQFHPPGEIARPLQADPEGLGTGWSIAFAPQMTAQAGDPAEHGRQRRREGWWRVAVNRDVNRPPFGRIQDHIARQVGGGPPQRGQVLNPPSDDQVQGQGRFQAFHGAELQGFHPATGFEDSKKNLDAPGFRTI